MIIVKKDSKSKEKRLPGRPKKAIKRSDLLMVRLTPTEKLLIENKAKIAGINPSEWFRQCAKKGRVIARFSKEDNRHFRVLSGLANNLNQLTHQAHISGLISLTQKCRSLMSQIEELLNHLNKYQEP